MKKGLFASLLALFSSASISLAQEPAYCPPDAPAGFFSGAGSGMPDCWTCPKGGCSTRFWVRTDYLNWWISNAPVGVPLVTTGNPASLTPGQVGSPGTRVLYGDSSVPYGAMPGGSLTMGGWLDSSCQIGIEGSGFLLGKVSNTFGVNSDAAGFPVLAVPFRTAAGAEMVRTLAAPATLITTGIFAGSHTLTDNGGASVQTTSRLWGSELNGVLNLYRNCNATIDFLGGFRYLDLEESLGLTTTSTASILPIPPDVGTVITTTRTFDQFSTRNQFYGGQAGVRGSFQVWRVSADIQALCAMGSTSQTVYSSGGTTTTGAASTAAGILTRANNDSHTNGYSVVPQMQLRIGYDITCRIRATIGYDALYWTNVVRPGNQIDNVSGGGLSNKGSDVWAHGVTAGLGIKF